MTNYPKTCKRGHDWATYRKPNGGNGGWACSLCRKYKWDADGNIMICSVDGCTNYLADGCDRKRNICATHRYRLNKWGTVDWVNPQRAETGKGYINTQGYREVSVNGVKMLEHRWIMAQALGRELLESENVHHINGDRSDNRIENLELWSTSQPSGQRVEDKLAWAREILSLYGYEVSDRAVPVSE